MREGSGLVKFAERFPDRYFDVGIAEQHAVTFAAGLACEGMKPVVAIYSTFLQRAYDQLIHDVADPEPAGGVRARPRAASSAPTARRTTALRPRVPALPAQHDGDDAGRRERVPADALHRLPDRCARRRCAIRAAPAPAWRSRRRCARCRSARREPRARGHARVAILAFGTVLKPALEAGEELDATVANMRFVKPLDERSSRSSRATHDAARHGRGERRDGRRRQRGARGARRGRARRAGPPARACPTASSTTATRTSCSRSPGSTRTASSSPSASGSPSPRR